MKTFTLETAEADIVYDVQGRCHQRRTPTAVLIGQPMDAGGFRTLASSSPTAP